MGIETATSDMLSRRANNFITTPIHTYKLILCYQKHHKSQLFVINNTNVTSNVSKNDIKSVLGTT